MHVVILVGKTIIVTGGSQVAFTINIKLIAPRKKCPNTKIKLTPSVQHGLLHVFLNDPQSVSWAGEYELLDILDVSEDLNSLALVESCGFDQPDVILAMLEWESLFLRATVVYLFEPIHELRDLMIVRVARHQKRCWCTIEDLISRLHRILVSLVILLETSNKTSLSAQSSQDFKVIVDKRSGIFGNLFVYLVIPAESEVGRPPQILTLLHALFLSNLN